MDFSDPAGDFSQPNTSPPAPMFFVKQRSRGVSWDVGDLNEKPRGTSL